MLNRTQQPLIRAIDKLVLPPVQTLSLDNGIPVYVVNMGTQEVLKLEIIFFAGRPFEHKKLVGRATAAMLKEGSKSYDSAAIAEQFDFYGSSFRAPFNIDTAVVELYSLNKYFDNVLPIVADILAEPSFPQKELDTYIHVNQQNLQIDLTKNDTIAYRTVTELIFGAEHPYGYNSFPATYGDLKREDLVEHYKRCFNSSNCAIVISGKVNDKILRSLNHYIGQSIAGGQKQEANFQRQSSPQRNIRIQNPDTVQMAIRVGREMFNRQHPDYPGMYVLNTLIGGYFSSRLMENIREDKGYTYNIYSVLDTMNYDGCFYIGTEVGNQFTLQTLDEIYREMEILRNELVEEEEFEMLYNYILGGFLNMLDGPFNVSDIVKTTVSEGLPITYFNELVQTIQAITSEDILALSQKYLNPNDYWEVIVGETSSLVQ
ncbi:MAG: pitrilysin family protein [Saprospiraceae bacterium]|nr:pitrilysin family protein [Saprospiraceae bacterium]